MLLSQTIFNPLNPAFLVFDPIAEKFKNSKMYEHFLAQKNSEYTYKAKFIFIFISLVLH
jgi:hypothetical protein